MGLYYSLKLNFVLFYFFHGFHVVRKLMRHSDFAGFKHLKTFRYGGLRTSTTLAFPFFFAG